MKGVLFDTTDKYLCVTDVVSLAKKLKQTTITTLDMHNCQLNDYDLKLIADVFKTNTTITSANLSDNYISCEGVKELVDGLISNTTLTCLNLCDNRICDTGANLLTMLPGIKDLDIGLNKCININALSTSITFFRLGCNSVNIKRLANILKTNHTLKSLHLYSVNIGNIGATFLAEMLKSNTTLVAFDLRWCKISKGGVEALTIALKTNTTITSVDLTGNKLKKVDKGVLSVMFPTIMKGCLWQNVTNEMEGYIKRNVRLKLLRGKSMFCALLCVFRARYVGNGYMLDINVRKIIFDKIRKTYPDKEWLNLVLK